MVLLPRNSKMKAFSILVISTALLATTACSKFPINSSLFSDNSSWKKSGALVLARNIPAEGQSFQTDSYLGFMPFSGSKAKTWLKLNKATGMLSLMSGKSELNSVSLSSETIAQFGEGLAHISLKQTDPVWYASDEYFTERKLSVPAAGSASRYLKAALGEHAIFLDNTLVIHSGSKSAGGISLNEADMKDIFSAIRSGDTLVIK